MSSTKKEDVMCLYEAFEKFEKCKRRKEQTISDFISEFELLNNKLVEQDMRIPDKFLGIKLLKSANLPESKEQLMKATATDVGFANMKSKLKSVFCDMVLQSPVKDEPEPEADMIGYTNNYNNRGGYYTSGCRGHLRDRGNDADHSRRDESDNYGAKDTQGLREQRKERNLIPLLSVSSVIVSTTGSRTVPRGRMIPSLSKIMI